MPLYEYKCESCQHEDTDFMPMRECTDATMRKTCPKCGDYSYCRQISITTTDMKEFHTPIDMLSVAANSLEEVRDIQQKCPDVEICDDESSERFGIPVARNRKQKLQVLKATGFRESGRGY